MLIFRPPRSDFWATITSDEQVTVTKHFEYLADLHELGIVKFAGRSEDAKFGLAIVLAESQQAAERIIAESPAVQAGLYSGEARAYRLEPH
jgi:uncharacterized protein YciI